MGTHLIRSAFAVALACAASAPTTASAAGSSAQGKAVTLRPLSLVKTADLEFGSLIPSATAGTAIVDASTDVRSVSGGVIGAGGSAPTAAKFTAAGLINVIAFITLPTSITLTRVSGTQTMTVDNITSNGPTLRLFPGSATIDVRVGGRLNIAANQVAGSYSGSFDVTVIYF
jgi:Domain of unknown function (DUF4402)